jgi:WD40 repeat protein
LPRRAKISAREGESRISLARELFAAALNNLAIDPERSILLALQAVTTTYPVDHKSVVPEAEDTLHQTVQASHVRLTLAGHSDVVAGIAFSQDGTRLATADDDNTAQIYLASIDELMTLARSRLTRG